MKKYISVGIYGMHRDKTFENDNTQFGLAHGISYLPNYDSQITLNFHKTVNIKLNDDGAILKLNLQEAKMLSKVLNNLTSHLEGKITLSKQKVLKDNAYGDEDADKHQTF